MKTIALVFIFLMFGSTFAYALLSSFRSQEEEIQMPEGMILTYELNEKQIRYLRSRGYTLIKYSYPTGCLDCVGVINNLERITQNSEGQIFLQEISTVDTSPKFTITSLRGEKTINNPTNEEIENTVCDYLLSRPLWCVKI